MQIESNCEYASSALRIISKPLIELSWCLGLLSWCPKNSGSEQL